MPSHSPATRPSRTSKRAPGRMGVGDAHDDKDEADEVASRSTALSPNRSVTSPAPGGEDQASPYSRRERVKKRPSDEVVGGIESLIPKARRGQGRGSSPLRVAGGGGAGAEVAQSAGEGEEEEGAQEDDDLGAGERPQKASKTEHIVENGAVSPVSGLVSPAAEDEELELEDAELGVHGGLNGDHAHSDRGNGDGAAVQRPLEDAGDAVEGEGGDASSQPKQGEDVLVAGTPQKGDEVPKGGLPGLKETIDVQPSGAHSSPSAGLQSSRGNGCTHQEASSSSQPTSSNADPSVSAAPAPATSTSVPSGADEDMPDAHKAQNASLVAGDAASGDAHSALGPQSTNSVAVTTAAAAAEGKPSRMVLWTPVDDVLLRHCVENGIAFSTMAEEMPFTCKFSVKDLERRWYSLLYDPDVAPEVASEIISLEYSAKLPGVKKPNPAPKTSNRIELASELLLSSTSVEAAAAHGMVALVDSASAGGGLSGPLAAVDGSDSHYLVYKDEISIGRSVPEEGATNPDIDLGLEGDARRVSRSHVLLKRDPRGVWCLTNMGKRILHVNGLGIAHGSKLDLPLRAMIVLCGFRLTFNAK